MEASENTCSSHVRDVSSIYAAMLVDPIEDGHTTTRRVAAELETSRHTPTSQTVAAGGKQDSGASNGKASTVSGMKVTQVGVTLEDVKVELSSEEVQSGIFTSNTLCEAAAKFGRYGTCVWVKGANRTQLRV